MSNPDQAVIDAILLLIGHVAKDRPAHFEIDGERYHYRPGPKVEETWIVPDGHWSLLRPDGQPAAIVEQRSDRTWRAVVYRQGVRTPNEEVPSRSDGIFWCLTKLFPEPEDPNATWEVVDPQWGLQLASVQRQGDEWVALIGLSQSQHPSRRAAMRRILALLVPQPNSPSTWGPGVGRGVGR